jgi:hypothetical protein
MKILSPEISLFLLILFLISQLLLYYFLFFTQVLNKRITTMLNKINLPFLLLLVKTIGCNSVEPPPDGNGVDTTSHNFTFQTWAFGEHSSSVLYDVAIVDENNIWACGEIYMNDTLGQPDPHPYGLIHWNGSEWEVKRITAQNPSGGYSYIIPTGVFALSTIEIWLASGGVFLFDGQSIIQAFWLVNYTGYTGGIFDNGETAQRLWGKSSTDLYTVGNNGAIAFYNGSSWQKIESGTELDIYDIIGQKTDTEDYEILCVAAKQSISTDKKIIQLENNMPINLSASGIPSSIRSIWYKPDKKYYVVGSGVFFKKDIASNQSWGSIGESITQYYLNSIDGNELNDITICGAYGELLHFNGASWKSFQNELQLEAGSYREIKIKDDFIIAVGYNSPQAIITIGRR